MTRTGSGAGRRPRGPRPGISDTRGSVLAAAREEFSARGFDGATIRGIAARAEVDPALVHHYFGSKTDLFTAALDFPMDPAKIAAEVTEGHLDGAGERLLRAVLAVWDDPKLRRPMLALLRTATTSEMGATMLREFLTHTVVKRIAAKLSPDHAQLRVALVGSQLAGLAMARYVIQLPPLASVSTESLVTAVAPNLQRYLTGDLGLS